LLGAVSEAHRLAGWASGDVGLIDQCRRHMHRAMDHAQGQPERLAGVLAAAGDMEKHYNAPNDALKFFQLGTAGLSPKADPQSSAVLHGLAASAYLTLGHADHARASLANSRAMFTDVPDPDSSLPFFAFYGPGHGLLAATGAKLVDYDAARTDVRRALDLRPEYDVRCRALDTIVLATILINAGELRDGISETRRALDLVTTVGSQRVRDRLEPLEFALSARRDSTCQDLVQRVRTLRVPATNTVT
jgi:tetratricopeptide (TPR) repeat protein